MAEASITGNQNQLSCSICLDLLKDPVNIPCGHSYCMRCIKSYWDQEDHLEVYSCPQCRETFTPRPVLGRNTILAEVVEKLKQTGLQAATTADHYAGPGDVECDFCTGRKCRAVKFCLVCLASYCETHLQPHYESPAFQKHKLADPTGHLPDKVCSIHDKPLESYCRTDQQCICYSCKTFEHRDHDTIAAAAERAEIQKDMGETQMEFQQRIEVREKELQELREAVASITHKPALSGSDGDVTLPEDLNEFYTWSDALNKEPVRKARPPTTDQVICLPTADVRRTLTKVNPQKTARPDNIPVRVLRDCADQLAEVFTDIFNTSLSQMIIPMCFKSTTIIPVPKKSSVTCLNDYHPVTLTSVIMKCFERLVMVHIKNSLPHSLDLLQFAYRSNRSTEDAKFSALHLSLSHLEKRDTYVRMLFIDFSSAFDTIIP
ncbi:uncharacterized protein [Paramormyrops kingsleyae]|uniref:uncharacterized protein n=1 Tax=Paramormyrops kingsleyae TaxID=1676925 RepID=UPI003B96D928